MYVDTKTFYELEKEMLLFSIEKSFPIFDKFEPFVLFEPKFGEA